jgi:predicted enzyme related to lactoylglutathione lyase
MEPGARPARAAGVVALEQEVDLNFNSILIGSEDPQRLADYYTGLFGQPAYQGEGYSSWLIGNGAITVGPHDQVKGKSSMPGRIIWNIESEDVKADFARLAAAGATVIREPYSFGEDQQAWIATFADPDDNYFQLTSPFEMPSAG